jgi:hypothetical protein
MTTKGFPLIGVLGTEYQFLQWLGFILCPQNFGIFWAHPIEITIKKQWFPTLKPRFSVKKMILGMFKINLDALASCASKSSKSFWVYIKI